MFPRRGVNCVRIRRVRRSLLRSSCFRFFLPLAALHLTGKPQLVNEIDIVRDISNKFARAGIDFMLTGSMAMNYYAQPRMTRDIDVVVAIGPTDADRVIDLFQPEYY